MFKQSLWRRALAAVFTFSLLFSLTPTTALAGHSSNNPDAFVLRVGSGYNYHIPVCPPFFFPSWDLGYPYHTRINEAMAVWNGASGEVYFYRTNTSCDSLEANKVPHIKIGWDTQMGFNSGPWAVTRVVRAEEGGFTAREWSTGWENSDPWREDGECPQEFSPGSACIIYAEIAFDYAIHSDLDWTSAGSSWNEGDGKAITIHELGHPLGFSDVPFNDSSGNPIWPCKDRTFPASYNAVMCGAIASYEHRWELHPHDIDAYNSKYN